MKDPINIDNVYFVPTRRNTRTPVCVYTGRYDTTDETVNTQLRTLFAIGGYTVAEKQGGIAILMNRERHPAFESLDTWLDWVNGVMDDYALPYEWRDDGIEIIPDTTGDTGDTGDTTPAQPVHVPEPLLNSFRTISVVKKGTDLVQFTVTWRNKDTHPARVYLNYNSLGTPATGSLYNVMPIENLVLTMSYDDLDAIFSAIHLEYAKSGFYWWLGFPSLTFSYVDTDYEHDHDRLFSAPSAAWAMGGAPVPYYYSNPEWTTAYAGYCFNVVMRGTVDKAEKLRNVISTKSGIIFFQPSLGGVHNTSLRVYSGTELQTIWIVNEGKLQRVNTLQFDGIYNIQAIDYERNAWPLVSTY